MAVNFAAQAFSSKMIFMDLMTFTQNKTFPCGRDAGVVQMWSRQICFVLKVIPRSSGLF